MFLKQASACLQEVNSAMWLDSVEEDLKEMVIIGREKNVTGSASNGE
jgi:hypothetical protein